MPKGHWSFPTSPRNPAQLAGELAILHELVQRWKKEGRHWSPRESTQAEFGQRLREMALAGGELAFQHQQKELTPENLAWTGRARFGSLKFLGFVWLDRDGFARVTLAGEDLITAPDPGEVILKQLIKWQYPDNQHLGAGYPESDLVLLGFRIRPLLAFAQLVQQLGGLTKEEIELFMIPLREVRQIRDTRKRIQEFRKKYEATQGRVPRRRLVLKTKQQIARALRKEGFQVKDGAWRDYADAFVRYCRFTGLFVANGRRLEFAKGRGQDVEIILGFDHTIFPNYRDSATFYAYYGDPTNVQLASDDPRKVKRIIRELSRGIRADVADLQRAGESVEKIPAPEIAAIEKDTKAAKSELARMRKTRTDLARRVMELKGRNAEFLRQALAFYDRLEETVDPPSYFEWNTWRCFVAINRARIIPNFLLDEKGEPIGHAPGGKPDTEVYFDEFDFVAVPEVTLRTHKGQWDKESGPVPRHVLAIQKAVAPRPTYGIFIAPQITEEAANQFFACYNQAILGEAIGVIPLTLDQFKRVLGFYTEKYNDFSPPQLKTLFDRILSLARALPSGREWLASISPVIDRWLADQRAALTA